jgi:Tfp pilus assembly protein PilF
LTGLAKLPWQGDHDAALALYGQVREKDPANADIYFRIGRVYLWKGEYDQARANFEKAASLDPQNTEVRRMLKSAAPQFRDHCEIRAEYQAESFSDGRKDYIDRRLALQFKLSTVGPLVLRASTTSRYEAKDSQYGFEFYPRLWSAMLCGGAYSPQHRYLPKPAVARCIRPSRHWDLSLGYG